MEVNPLNPVSGHRKLLLIVGVLAVCVIGVLVTVAVAARHDSPATLAAFTDDPLVTCGGGGPPFHASKLPGSGGSTGLATPMPPELVAVLNQYHDMPEVSLDPADVVLVSQTDSDAELVGPKDGGYGFVRFARHDGTWQWAGSGGCDAAIVPQSKLSPVSIVLDVRQPITPSTTELHLFVQEQACNGGKLTQPSQVVGPEVHVDANRIVVTAAVRPEHSGVQTCPGALSPEGPPGAEAVVALDAPVGDRAVLDGTRYPFAPVSTWDGDRLNG